jgi:hypothetical protein
MVSVITSASANEKFRIEYGFKTLVTGSRSQRYSAFNDFRRMISFFDLNSSLNPEFKRLSGRFSTPPGFKPKIDGADIICISCCIIERAKIRYLGAWVPRYLVCYLRVQRDC